MSGSRSQAATISHPSMRCICEACASAILPQPTMATLSMSFPPAAFKMAHQTFRGRHSRSPSYAQLEFLVAVSRPLPEAVPLPAIEGKRQLPLGPDGILFPQVTKRIAHGVGNVERPELPHVAFV